MKTASPETFRALLSRINAETTPAGLAALEKQATRHYDNGTLTASELKRLDVRIMERLAKLETPPATPDTRTP